MSEVNSLATMSLEGHPWELSGLGVHGNVETSFLQVNAVCPGRRAALMDFANSILKRLVLKNPFRALRLIIGHTPPEFMGATKILLKKP